MPQAAPAGGVDWVCHSVQMKPDMRCEVDTNRIVCLRMPAIGKRPKLEFQDFWRRRDIEIAVASHCCVIGGFVAVVGWLTGRIGHLLRSNATRPNDKIRNLLTCNTARIPLVIMRVTREECVRPTHH